MLLQEGLKSVLGTVAVVLNMKVDMELAIADIQVRRGA